jgi:Anti-sigma factor NepR
MARGSAARPDVTERNPLRAEAIMHTDAQVRKAGGRLSREDQRRIGDILQRVYDDVLRQGVPDRFKDLLGRFEQSSNPGAAEAQPQGREEGRQEPDRLIGAKAFENKGSRS